MMYLEELIECIVGEHCNNESINVKSSWCSVDCLGKEGIQNPRH